MKDRTLKVITEYRRTNAWEYRYTGFRTIPKITLMGDWLREAGFSEEDMVTVNCRKGKLTIKNQKEKE